MHILHFHIRGKFRHAKTKESLNKQLKGTETSLNSMLPQLLSQLMMHEVH